MILDVLAHPEVTYSQNTHGSDRQVRQRGRLGIVVDERSHTVITVLFRTHEAWLEQQEAARIPA